MEDEAYQKRWNIYWKLEEKNKMFIRRNEKNENMNRTEGPISELTQEEIERIKLIPFLEWLRGRRERIWKWGILYAFLLGLLVTQVKLVYLTSESIPYKYCLQFYNIKPAKGDLCVFDCYPRSKKGGDNKKTRFTFVKYIAGIEGDNVSRKGNKIFINDKLVGEAKNEEGLHPIDSTVIPKGYVFVRGEHENSLDSRYREFGLVREDCLKGKAIGWLKR